MKASVYHEYGPPEVLHSAEVKEPKVGTNDVLIRVRAVCVNYGDITARNFSNIPANQFNMPLVLWIPAKLAFGLRKPRNPILGSEFAGDVVAVGSDVKKFRVGNRVFGYRGMKMGACAEYLSMPEKGMLGIMPENMTHEEAATVPYGGIMSLSLLRKAPVVSGQKVLIIGASGGIGSIALQLARHYGATVTGVCGTQRLDYVRALGADRVIDYTADDYTQTGERYDLIVDVLGRSDFMKCKGSLTDEGRYLSVSFKTGKLLQMLRTSMSSGKKLICALAGEDPGDLLFLKELAESGHVRSIIDKCFPLEEAAAAHRYVEEGRKKGSVVLTVGPSSAEQPAS
mgnify:CR=1 FL=1